MKPTPPGGTSDSTGSRGGRRRWPIALALSVVLGLLLGADERAEAQQFNSDNYLSMPHGTGTFVLTHGESYSTLLNSFALFPSWEFFAGATLYWTETERSTDSFSTTLFVKKMFYENEAKNGGFAVMGGTGGFPGYLQGGEITGSFHTYWIAAPLSLPLLKGKLLWDVMPGGVYYSEYGLTRKEASAFTWSTRAALYGVVPQSAIVGELFGAEGEAEAEAQFKVGLRWEPSEHFVAAVTYGAGLDGSQGAGWEVGVMMFSPPFLCFGGCK